MQDHQQQICYDIKNIYSDQNKEIEDHINRFNMPNRSRENVSHSIFRSLDLELG